ncbi:hypothetical protein [Saccharopolyspora sp.]|uniref:hypothetical protein n=1 Tax=Saccharopolyspora sp. TaxID=33915 RepID=UPI0025DC5BE9|nr:hypothetical protein [Saccharopolyspora sp.]
MARWAFQHDVDALFAVVRPDNARAATFVRRNGMEWVGETSKYFGATMQLYRLRPADFDQVRQVSLPPGFETEQIPGFRLRAPAKPRAPMNPVGPFVRGDPADHQHHSEPARGFAGHSPDTVLERRRR